MRGQGRGGGHGLLTASMGGVCVLGGEERRGARRSSHCRQAGRQAGFLANHLRYTTNAAAEASRSSSSSHTHVMLCVC